MKEQMNGIKEGVEIDLQKLLLTYLRRWWIIALCGLLAALCAYHVTANYIVPTYRAGVMVYVNNRRTEETIDTMSNSNLSASKQLVKTYINIISSDSVLEKVVERGKLNLAPAQVRAMMTTEQVEETELFRVYITHPDPQVAAEVANIIADVAPDEIGEIVEGSSTKIVDYAKIPTSRHSPSYRRNTVIGGVLGVLAAVLYVTIGYLMDVRIKDSEDIEMMFTLPILGQIPVFATADTRKKGYGYGSKGYGYQQKKSSGSEEGM